MSSIRLLCVLATKTQSLQLGSELVKDGELAASGFCAVIHWRDKMNIQNKSESRLLIQSTLFKITVFVAK